ncbi:MAG: carboxymuconolactone decarboxylase family protein [Legionella sp.]
MAPLRKLTKTVIKVNGCGVCVSSHTRQLIEQGFMAAAIARIGRISAVIHAVHVSRTWHQAETGI